MKKSFARVAASTVVMTAGFGLAGLGAAAIAQAQPAPFPDYHWCPAEYSDPGYLNKGSGYSWDRARCRHDTTGADGEAGDGYH
jgi:hypothetical protein